MKNAFLLAVLLFGIATGEHSDSTEESLKRGLSNKCAARETSSCIAYELVGYVDRMLRTASFQLTDDVMVVDDRYHDGFVHSVAGETLARTDVTPPDEGPPTGPKPSRYLPRLNPNQRSSSRDPRQA